MADKFLKRMYGSVIGGTTRKARPQKRTDAANKLFWATGISDKDARGIIADCVQIESIL